MVPVFAYGVRGSDFSGMADNTIIGNNIIHYIQSHRIME